MVIVTLNGILDEYQMFIFSLVAREKAPTFDELEGTILQEEEQKNNLNFRSQSSYLVLVAKGKQPSKGNPGEESHMQIHRKAWHHQEEIPM
jgi:hypothetical protein